MIVCLDASSALLANAELVGTATISRAEVASALARAVRMQVLLADEARCAIQVFNAEWDDILRNQITESLISRPAGIAWDHGLRGHGAVQLSAALTWRELLGETITLATYDRHLWKAALSRGLAVWPEALG